MLGHTSPGPAAVGRPPVPALDVALTPEGRQRFAEVWPALEEGVGRYFVDPLTQADIDELGRILARLIQSNEPENG